MNKKVVGISSIAYDIVGAKTVYVEPGAFEAMNTGNRRATRTKTLDGGAIVYDAGYSIADRTFNIETKVTSATTANWFARLVKTYNLIRITTEDGVFSAVPARWAVQNGTVTFEALIMSQIA